MPKPSEIPPDDVVHVNGKGLMDEAGMKLWINSVWERRKSAMMKMSSLLVLDQFSCYLKNSVKKKLRQRTSGRTFSQLQPFDASINKPFKMYMREEWNKWMMNETQHEFTTYIQTGVPVDKTVMV